MVIFAFQILVPMTTANERIKREQEFHNQIFNDKSRKVTDKFYSIFSLIEQQYVTLLTHQAQGKNILEYGCGEGSSAYLIAQNGGQVTGIDISDYAIEQARTKAKNMNLPITFKQMNAEALEFENQSFDLVCGSGIIHHLDIEKSYHEISRVLRPGGKAIFMEPLGHNPLINWYRNRTPHLRTEDEHPLLQPDLKALYRYFGKVKLSYFFLSSLAAIAFRNTFVFKPLLKCLHGIDRCIFTVFPFMRKQAWFVLIEAGEPLNITN
jgi:ubiquinone/menaquinone biosynthesis C-methylase UbiE